MTTCLFSPFVSFHWFFLIALEAKEELPVDLCKSLLQITRFGLKGFRGPRAVEANRPDELGSLCVISMLF